VTRTTLGATMTAIAAISLAVLGCHPKSHAQPPAFPDLGSYTPVNVADYSIEIPNAGRPQTSSRVYFLTPDGNACVVDPAAADCTGNNFPGVSPNTQTSAQGAHGANWIGTNIPLQQTGTPLAPDDHTIQGHPIRPLPPLHSLTVGATVCGVDAAGTTACKDPQGQGFMISPQGTFSLPHV
jgi:hypothetical protein